MPWREARYDAKRAKRPTGITFIHHERNHYEAIPSTMLMIHVGKFARVRMFHDIVNELVAFQFCNGASMEGVKVRKRRGIFSYWPIRGIIIPKIKGKSAFIELKEKKGMWVAEI